MKMSYFFYRTFTIFLLLFFLYGKVNAENVPINFSSSKDSAKIEFRWSQHTSFNYTTDKRELLLQFINPIEAPELSELPKNNSDWIEGISIGFDSVLLTASRDVTFNILTEGNNIVVVLKKVLSNPPKKNTTNNIRLKLLKIQLLANTGKEYLAFKMIKELTQKHPKNSDILSNLASIEWQLGRWRQADMIYKKALNIDPNNKGIQKARKLLRREQTPSIGIENKIKKVKNGEQHIITTINGYSYFTDYFYLGFIHDIDYVKITNLRRTDGNIRNFDGTRNRNEIFTKYDFKNGSWGKLSLFNNLSIMGSGIQFSLWDKRGTTLFQIDYNRPDWEYIEEVVEEITRNRLKVSRKQKINTDLALELGLLGQGFNTKNNANIARSYEVFGSIRYTIFKEKPFISIGYRLDSNYLDSVKTLIDSSGNFYNPLPIIKREIHSLDIYSHYILKNNLFMDWYAGYAIDRLGSDAVFFGLNLTYRFKNELETKMYIDHGQYTVNSNQTQDIFGWSLLWRF